MKEVYRLTTGSLKPVKALVDDYDEHRLYGKMQGKRSWPWMGKVKHFFPTLTDAKQFILDTAYEEMEVAINKYKALCEEVKTIFEEDCTFKNGKIINLRSDR